MGKIRKTYDTEFKKKVINLHYKEGMGYEAIAKKLGIGYSIVRRWINHFEAEGIKGLEEKRGKAKGPGTGRPRTRPEDPEEKIKAENEMLKSSWESKRGYGIRTYRYEVIIQEMSKKYTVQLLCELAGVSRDGYYKWVKRQESPSLKQVGDNKIKKLIMECHTKLRGIYGYRRVQVWLQSVHNLHMNHKRVQRLMGVLGIKAIIRRKRPYYGKKEAYVISENHLNRDFNASKPNEKWVTDITYLIFNGQRLYLSAIKDLYNNEIIAYEISRRNDLKLLWIR
ncbi:IS3 family transposase [Pseudalkalibacillus sp. A8]|uniref:IS3 family transposase n=1 Tax=Pseudalkalibacillus sp. A8 TaxID=3382641 RepID=UPI0038B528EB